MKIYKYFFTLFFLTALIYAPFASAEENKSGVSPQVISLPSGPGSIEGLGESFEPQLNTGTASYAVPLKVQNGITGHQPDIRLIYEGGRGNGAFGVGWDMPVPYIQRQTDKGLPLYVDEDDGIDNDHDGQVDEMDERDVFIYSNGEDLVPLSNGDYRCRNEQEFIRFQRKGDAWEAKKPDGTWLKFGTTTDSRIYNDSKIFRWYLQESMDTNGNFVLYKYESYPDSPGMVYCKEIRYGGASLDAEVFHAIVFNYETRHDNFMDFRSTFEVNVTRRCTKIEMITQGTSLPGAETKDHNADGIEDALIRRYLLDYKENSDFSLISQITQKAADGINYLPPITFEYTSFEPNSGGETAVVFMENPPPYGFADEDTEIFDINADSLPDLYHTSGNGHYYYQNLGNGIWADTLTSMKNGPSSTALLSSSGTHLSDVNGDGISDFVVKAGSQSFFFLESTGKGEYKDSQPLYFFGEIPTFPFDGNSNVRLIDINFDKKIDIMLTTSSQYFYWFNLGNGKFSDRVSGPVALVNPSLAFKFEDKRARLGDMNGDRLQDLVLVQSGAICYFPNIGHGKWHDKIEMTGSPAVGFREEFLLLDDINSDGLFDVILEQTGRTGEIDYWINLGNNSFSEQRTITGLPGIISNTTIRIADINGNGTADIVWSSPTADSRLKYRYLDLSAGVQPNLLNLIDNGLGRRIKIDYKASTAYYTAAFDSDEPWTVGLPFPVTVASKMTVTSGLDLDDVPGNDAYITEYVYHDGYYDGIEKEFRGFAKVEKVEYGDDSSPTKINRYYFHTGGPDGLDNDDDGTIDEHSEDNIFEDEPLKGKVLKAEVESESGLKYTQEKNLWAIKTLQVGTNEKEVRFAYNEENESEIIEGSDSPITLKTTYLYDDFGNVTEEKNWGALSITGDEVFTYTEYIHDTEKWIIDKPKRRYQSDADGSKVSEARYYYDGEPFAGLEYGMLEKGNLVREEGWVAEDTYINILRNAHDDYGNIIGIKDGNGNLREIEYDDVFHTFPVKEIIHVGEDTPPLIITAEYHTGFGVMTKSLDFNGHATAYVYDSFGRLVKIIKPGDSSEYPTQCFIYTPSDPVRGLIYNYDEAGNLTLINKPATPSAVLTKTRENFRQPGTFDVVQYTDGLGRKLALIEEAEQGFVVKEAFLFNAKGTAKFAFLPYQTGTFEYQPPSLSNAKTETHYDAMAREILRINPPDKDGTVTQASTHYFPLKSEATDENSNSKTLISDGLERLIEVHENNQEETYITRYTYDPLGNLTKITDAQNNVKTMSFDGLKRKTEMNDPDSGQKFYEYDNVGNLIQTTDNKGQIIQYTHDGANRILTEDYLDEAGISPDVAFHYDSPSSDWSDAENVKGSLSWIEDLSGAQFLSYDNRGNTSWQVKRIDQDNVFQDFRTAFTYDAMERVTSMIYPDGDQLSYSYNNRSLLNAFPGIVNAMDYHVSGQIASMDYANGVTTDYSYDPRQRLSGLNTLSSLQSNTVIQNLDYTMDGVGNITAIKDLRSIPDDSPQNATQAFQYDDLYRLTQAKGPGYGAINFQYDKIGNMTFKKSPEAPAQTHIDDELINLGTMDYGGTGGSSNRTGRMPGDAPGPHAVTKTQSGLVYDYDDNGNMVSHATGDTYSWDFRDRLIRVQKGETDTHYVYDYGGQRIIKKIKEGNQDKTTLYVSNDYEIREGKIVKYVFAGNRRVARIEGNFSNQDNPTYQTLSFQPGWNFFSLSVEPDNSAIDEVLEPLLGNYTEIWAYDTVYNQYVGYSPDISLSDLAEIHAQKGYLINIVNPVTLLVHGSRVTADIPLTSGWNLAACPSNSNMKVEDAVAAVADKLFSVWHYEAATQTWKYFDPKLSAMVNTLKEISPGNSYWMNTSESGDLPYMQQPTKIYFYHPDHLGSSSVVTDMDGEVVSRTEYYPFGRPRYEEDNGFQSEYKYTGKELDDESGLMYYGARYYDAVVGRFVSVDPLYVEISDLKKEKFETILSDPQILNTYLYVNNNPLIYTDPDGLSKFKFWKTVYKIAKARSEGNKVLDILEDNKATLILGTFGAIVGSYIGGPPGSLILGEVMGSFGGMIDDANYKAERKAAYEEQKNIERKYREMDFKNTCEKYGEDALRNMVLSKEEDRRNLELVNPDLAEKLKKHQSSMKNEP